MNFDPRDLEWQRRYEANDTPWDKGAASPVLEDYLYAHAITGRVLVPGCGRGHDARRLAAQPGAAVVGLDLSPLAVEQARALTPPGAAVEFVTGDFFALADPFAGAFDWVVEHTCFCAIEPKFRAAYAAGAARALRPGGKLFGIFYLDPGHEAGPPFRVSRDELAACFDAEFDLLESWVPERAFPGREGRELVQIHQRRAGSA
jgi:SAM-dependent methyltransferase